MAPIQGLLERLSGRADWNLNLARYGLREGCDCSLLKHLASGMAAATAICLVTQRLGEGSVIAELLAGGKCVSATAPTLTTVLEAGSSNGTSSG